MELSDPASQRKKKESQSSAASPASLFDIRKCSLSEDENHPINISEYQLINESGGKEKWKRLRALRLII